MVCHEMPSPESEAEPQQADVQTGADCRGQLGGDGKVSAAQQNTIDSLFPSFT